jgi:hypothetical protein
MGKRLREGTGSRQENVAAAGHGLSIPGAGGEIASGSAQASSEAMSRLTAKNVLKDALERKPVTAFRG